MHPILFSLGPVDIRSYGFMLAIAFLTGILLGAHQAEKNGIKPNVIYDLSIYLMLGAIIGARLFYVVFHWSDFNHNLLAIINPIQEGKLIGIEGMNMYGGVILSMLTGIGYLYRHHLPVWKIADLLIPYLALGTAITRIGCFLNGCCFGNPTQWLTGIVFPEESLPAMIYPHAHLHPTQLYESIYSLLLFLILFRVNRSKKFDGFAFWLWILLYAIFRFFIEFIRYYEDAMYLIRTPWQITMNQGIALLAFILSLTIMIFKNHHASATTVR